jgi:hypothetical protein
MLARCARCQNNFTTERFGLQRCPHCDSELMLADPNAGPPVPPGGSSLDSGPQGGPTLGMSGPPGPTAGGPGTGGLPPVPPPPGGAAWPPPPGGGGFGPPPGPPSGGELPAPFAERGRIGWMTGYFETWKLVATKPQEFFGRVRIDRTGSAVLFGILSATVGNVVSSLYGWLAGAQSVAAMRELMEQMPAEQQAMFERFLPYMTGGALWQILFAPVGAVIGIYVWAAIVHLLLLLFRGAGRGFDATLTVVGYGYGLMLLLAVPACGGLVAGIWFLVVLVIGLAAAQRCGQGRAAAAVLTPIVLFCCCCLGVAGVAGLGVLKALGGAAGGGAVEL